MEAIHWLIDQVKWLVGLANPEKLEEVAKFGGHWWIGYAILSAVIFSETGLLVGFFLPGDSLLFAAGFLASKNIFDIFLLNTCLVTAAVLGDAANYYLGLQMSEHVFERGRLRFVKHEHLLAAKRFYEKHGAMAIILARFVPLVRTFTPFVAGVARMGYRKFALYNITGGFGWVVSMTLAGYWLGRIPIIARNFEVTVLGVVVLSVVPLLIGILKNWRQSIKLRRDGAVSVSEAAGKTEA